MSLQGSQCDVGAKEANTFLCMDKQRKIKCEQEGDSSSPIYRWKPPGISCPGQVTTFKRMSKNTREGSVLQKSDEQRGENHTKLSDGRGKGPP